METPLIIQARLMAEKTFSGKAFQKRDFHNIHHTQEVVKYAEEIAFHSQLSKDETESVIIASWLHDIGYEQGAENHEDVAAAIAHQMLNEWGATTEKITAVTEAIISTKMPQQPKSLVSKVLCDADLSHLSSSKCDEHSFKLRQEWRSLGYKEMPDEEWLQFNLQFMESHRYDTPFGQTVLEQGKKKNIKRLKKQLSIEDNGPDDESLQEEVERL